MDKRQFEYIKESLPIMGFSQICLLYYFDQKLVKPLKMSDLPDAFNVPHFVKTWPKKGVDNIY